MSGYWPWWAGAVGLALVTVNYTLITDRSLGVSGAWQRVVHWRREREAERLDDGIDQEALVAALAAGPGASASAAATPAANAGNGTVVHEPSAGSGADTSGAVGSEATPPRRLPLVTQLALLVSITLGGMLAAAVSGRLQLRFDMGEAYRTLVTGNPLIMVVTLFVGGVLVGFGTRLAGGCSSGHGLSGCGRLYPVSFLATAVFFGTAVLVSFLLVAVA